MWDDTHKYSLTLTHSLTHTHTHTLSTSPQRRTDAYHQRVREAIAAGKVIAILTRSIPARLFVRKQKIEISKILQQNGERCLLSEAFILSNFESGLRKLNL